MNCLKKWLCFCCKRTDSANEFTLNPNVKSFKSCLNNAKEGKDVVDKEPSKKNNVVTFLDKLPTGSNGVVKTSSKLLKKKEPKLPKRVKKHTNLDTIESCAEYNTNHNHNSNNTYYDDSTPPQKNCYRVILLGSPRVGKSSIVARFLDYPYEDPYTPTIEDFHRKLYRIRNELFQLDLLDTSGYHPYPAMRRMSYLTGDAFILVFSMDSRESFEEVVRLRENIIETKWSALNPRSGFRRRYLPKIPMVIAGNKCDKGYKSVHLDEVMGYLAGQDSCCAFVECSAFSNYQIDDLFFNLFQVASMPTEMAPNHHRHLVSIFGAPSPLPPHTSSGGSKRNALSIKRRFSDACGVVTASRRPSLRSDLNLMRLKTMALHDAERRNARGFCSLM